jgi:hypothetical protein
LGTRHLMATLAQLGNARRDGQTRSNGPDGQLSCASHYSLAFAYAQDFLLGKKIKPESAHDTAALIAIQLTAARIGDYHDGYKLSTIAELSMLYV